LHCSFLLQKALISSWRAAFASPNAFFGFVVMEPWFYPPAAPGGSPLPDFRRAQLAALSLPVVGYASAVDLGDSTSPFGSIHVRSPVLHVLFEGWAEALRH
jgi:hypothetical protein